MASVLKISSRREFIALAAAFGLQGAVAGAQSPPAQATVRVSSAPDEDILGTIWGIQSGSFKKNGLDVDLRLSNSGAAVAASVIGGSVDVGKSSMFSLISAHLRGLPITLIAAAAVYNTKVPAVGLIVKKGSPIRTAADLNGKTISVQALNDQYAVAVKAWSDQHGGNSASLHFLELPSSAAAEGIDAGRVDAAATTNPILSEAIAGGKVQEIGHPFDGIGPFFVQAAYFCTNDYARDNRDTIQRFSRALDEASTYVNSHHAQTAVALSSFTKVPLDIVQQMTRTQLATKIDPAVIQPVIDSAFKYKAIDKAFDAKEMIAPFMLRTS
jgi:NitT/TauT family transport system substrate-binding protein